MSHGCKFIKARLAVPNAASVVLYPASYARAVAAIDIAELAREIGFLSGYDTVSDHEHERYQRHQQPKAVECDGQADLSQEHAEVDRVARKAIRSMPDDDRGRSV